MRRMPSRAWSRESAGEVGSELLSKLANADMQAAPKALLRAASRAREIARQTNTAIVIVRNGVLVEECGTESDEENMP